MIDLGGDVTGNGIGELRERSRDVKRHLASQGVYGGRKRPFGYDVVDKRLVSNPKEQEAMARMRALRVEGKTYREIAFQATTEFGITLAPYPVTTVSLRDA
jgi:putative DNA-invertase from lambdoid prophage Rac